MAHCVPANSIATHLSTMFKTPGVTGHLPRHQDQLPPMRNQLGSMERCHDMDCEAVGLCVPDMFDIYRPEGVSIPQRVNYGQYDNEDACIDACRGRTDCSATLRVDGMCKMDDGQDHNVSEADCTGEWVAGTHCALIETAVPAEAIYALPEGRVRVYSLKEGR